MIKDRDTVKQDACKTTVVYGQILPGRIRTNSYFCNPYAFDIQKGQYGTYIYDSTKKNIQIILLAERDTINLKVNYYKDEKWNGGAWWKTIQQLFFFPDLLSQNSPKIGKHVIIFPAMIQQKVTNCCHPGKYSAPGIKIISASTVPATLAMVHITMYFLNVASETFTQGHIIRQLQKDADQ